VWVWVRLGVGMTGGMNVGMTGGVGMGMTGCWCGYDLVWV